MDYTKLSPCISRNSKISLFEKAIILEKKSIFPLQIGTCIFKVFWTSVQSFKFLRKTLHTRNRHIEDTHAEFRSTNVNF